MRRYPTHEVLAWLFGVSDSTVLRIIARLVPVPAQLGQDTIRFPDPGRYHRRQFDELLADLPELAVVIATFEHQVQRPQHRAEVARWYSGKKKTPTIKSQVAVDVHSGRLCAIGESVPRPRADITLLKQSGRLDRLPVGVGAAGDRAYVGIAAGVGSDPAAQAARQGQAARVGPGQPAPAAGHRVQPGLCATADHRGTPHWALTHVCLLDAV